jgi:chemotaxis protein CheD
VTAETIENVVIGLGQLYVRKSPSVLVCLGLGSCIALSIYDPKTTVGGMVHIVLPDGSGRADQNSPKYADSAVSLLVEEVIHQGGMIPRSKIRIVGGSKMAGTGSLGTVFKIGKNNIDATLAALAARGITNIDGSDVGGSHGRTVRLRLDTGKMTVTASGHESLDI